MMRRTVGLLLSFAMIFSLAACSHSAASERQGDQSDSVSVQSDGVQDSTGDNIIDMAEQSDEQRNMTQDTDQEQDDPNACPGISGNVENMDSYDTILIGYPHMEQGFESVLCV